MVSNWIVTLPPKFYSDGIYWNLNHFENFQAKNGRTFEDIRKVQKLVWWVTHLKKASLEIFFLKEGVKNSQKKMPPPRISRKQIYPFFKRVYSSPLTSSGPFDLWSVTFFILPFLEIHSLKLKMGWPRFWDGLVSWAMIVLGRVTNLPTTDFAGVYLLGQILWSPDNCSAPLQRSNWWRVVRSFDLIDQRDSGVGCHVVKGFLNINHRVTRTTVEKRT